MAQWIRKAGEKAAQEPPSTDSGNVVMFARRVPPLSDAETVAMRKMLAQWEVVKRDEPMIRWLIGEE